MTVSGYRVVVGLGIALGICGLACGCERTDPDDVPVPPASTNFKVMTVTGTGASSNGAGEGGSGRGDPTCSKGVPNFGARVCCLLTCEKCVQTGCELRGRPEHCCPDTIKKSNRYCEDVNAPCKL